MEGVLSEGVLSKGVLSEGVLSGGGFVRAPVWRGLACHDMECQYLDTNPPVIWMGKFVLDW